MAGTRTSPEPGGGAGDPAPPVPLFDLRLTEEDLAAVGAALRSGCLSRGPRTAAFEAAFASHLGCRHAIAVSSCTAALQLAYLAAGVGPGDEVIVPAMTFAATAAAVVHCGATPVFADVVGVRDPSIDPAHVAELLTARTKAVTAVHFGGYAAPIAALRSLCDARGVALVEDAAHAPRATAADPRLAGEARRLGTWGLAGCFSFFSNKVLSAGEGGLVATDDDAFAALVRKERSRGDHHLDEPRSALLLSRLAHLEDDVGARRRHSLGYRAELAGMAGLELPYTTADVASSSCYVMPVLITDAARRDPLRLALRERHGIQTSVLYPAVHRLSAYRRRWPTGPLPRTERFSAAEITLPLHPGLSAQERGRVVAALEAELA